MLGWISILSLIGFFVMGADKSRARYGGRRIPERVLFEIALMGGAFGIVAGSSIFHHKTLKFSFVEVAYIAAVAWMVVLIGLEHLLVLPNV